MARSPGFGSIPCDYSPVKTRFPTAPYTVNLATEYKSLTHYTKVRSHPIKRLLLLVRTRFQVLFHSLAGVLFAFPSRYWFTIGQSGVFSLGGWSPIFRQDNTCPALLVEFTTDLRIQGYHLLLPDFPDRSPDAMLIKTLAAPRSLAATTESRLISFPRGTEMFQFPGSLRLTMYSQMIVCIGTVSHSEIVGCSGSYHLPTLSQISTSFIASDCLGIHRVRLVA